MSERRCEGCRWFRCDIQYQNKQHGVCRRNPPVSGEFPEVHGDSMCGEWADAKISPQQAEREELVRRFALAITEGWYASDSSIGPEFPADAWKRAKALADAEGQP